MGIPFCYNQWFSVYSNKDDLSLMGDGDVIKIWKLYKEKKLKIE